MKFELWGLLAVLLLAAAMILSKGETIARQERGEQMIEATKALVSAHAALEKQYPGRRVGNIVVEPAGDHYAVVFDDLGARGREKTIQSVRAIVDSRSGIVTELKELAVANTPNAQEPPASTISGRQAFDISIQALQGHDTYEKTGKLTVKLVGDVYQVTYPLPAAQKTNRSADYAFQVWVHAVTGKVTKVLVAS